MLLEEVCFRAEDIAGWFRYDSGRLARVEKFLVFGILDFDLFVDCHRFEEGFFELLD